MLAPGCPPARFYAPWRVIYLNGDCSLWVAVSCQDYDFLTAYLWNIKPQGNGASYPKRNAGPARTPVYLHREVTIRAHGEPPDGAPLSDHIDGNTLDARRENLRWASHSLNNSNRGLFRTKLVPQYDPEPFNIPF